MTKFYYTIFNILALTAIIYTGIDSFYRIVKGQLQQVHIEETEMKRNTDKNHHIKVRLTDFRAITDRNLFTKVEKPQKEPDQSKIESLEPTSLKIALMGTIVGDRENAAAVIEDTGKRKQDLYRVGDSIQNAVLKTILRGKVVLQVGDKDEILIMEETDSTGRDQENRKTESPSGGELPGTLTPGSPPERTISVRRSDIDNAVADINDLLSQASIRPHFTDGEADGLAITGIRAGSIFRKMGLRNGDIVQGVNERDIQTPDDLISLYNDLTSDSEVSLQIKRRGRERTINYIFRE